MFVVYTNDVSIWRVEGEKKTNLHSIALLCIEKIDILRFSAIEMMSCRDIDEKIEWEIN